MRKVEPISRINRLELRQLVEDSEEIRKPLEDTQVAVGDLEDRIVVLETADDTAFGVISCSDANSPQDIETTFEILTAWTTEGAEHNTIVSSSNNLITCTKAGTYLVSVQISFEGTPLKEFEFRIHKNAVYTGFGTHRLLGAAGDIGSCSIVGIVSCAANEFIWIYFKSDAAGSEVTVSDAQLVVTRIGD